MTTRPPYERSQNAQNLSGEDLPFPDNSEQSMNAAVWYQGDRLQARVQSVWQAIGCSQFGAAIDVLKALDADLTQIMRQACESG